MGAIAFARFPPAAAVRAAVFRPLATLSTPQRRLVLYSKPGCCLCDGLKEKLAATSAVASGGVSLEVRDITQNHEWERLYEYEIPVLARVLPDGGEEILPRLSPRLSVELIHKKISVVFGE